MDTDVNQLASGQNLLSVAVAMVQALPLENSKCAERCASPLVGSLLIA